ncbi:MAG: amidohydrolase family protein [bacterium]|nr:amidohydrolase family protein [bacterium]
MMTETSTKVSRRSTMKSLGLIGSTVFLTGGTPVLEARAASVGQGDFYAALCQRIDETPFIDTHEHLLEEEERLQENSGRIKANDWSFILSHYLDSDLLSAGMPRPEYEAFFSAALDPMQKWAVLEPWWWAVRHTGYGQAVEIAVRKLYDVEGLTKDSIVKIQEGYLKGIQPGFYTRYLRDFAGIESCQVNCLSAPFSETSQPLLLMQDLSIIGMHMGPNIGAYAPKAGIEVKELADWHRVIDWWFEHYGPYATAVKSQAAYSRNIDFDPVPAERAEPLFLKRIRGESLDGEEKKALEDHLFWYAVGKANHYNLPVKLHTGYYAGTASMPLGRLAENGGAASDLCRRSPETRFDFFHINYPNYEELIAAAKQYPNAYVDMCWAWIVNPAASVDFLKKYIVTAPINKIFTFGGDYIPVEPVIGHAAIARRGIGLALAELVQEGWLTQDGAMDLVEPLLCGNARKMFALEAKSQSLKNAPWRG